MSFSKFVIKWYNQHKRDLPWRHTRDPYKIWLSEVILQQTRVEQGMSYYIRFSETYHTVRDFAAASEDDILKLWQGLGYYSRGRNMLVTARQVVQDHNGVFPTGFDELIRLKGIGPYTAAAISSFSADGPHAVVDGNVYRVIARFFGVAEPSDTSAGKKQVGLLAEDILDRQHPGLHNQAMIEFGALLCKPRKPDCAICPVALDCFAFSHGKTAVLPTAKKKKALRNRYFHFAVFSDENAVLLSRRDETDIWAGLYQPLLIEADHFLNEDEFMSSPEMRVINTTSCPLQTTRFSLVHLLTHQKIQLGFVVFKCRPGQLPTIPGYHPVNLSRLKSLAFPQPVFIIFKNVFNL